MRRSGAQHRLPASSPFSSSAPPSSPDMAAPAEPSGLTDEAAYAACSEPDASTKVGWVAVTGALRGRGARSFPVPSRRLGGRTCGAWELAWEPEWGRAGSRRGSEAWPGPELPWRAVCQAAGRGSGSWFGAAGSVRVSR